MANRGTPSGNTAVHHNSLTNLVNNVADYTVDASLNWWGHETGPYHDDTNLDGQGNAVSDNILFDPWWVNEEMAQDSNYVSVPAPTPALPIPAPTEPAIEPTFLNLGRGPAAARVPTVPAAPASTPVAAAHTASVSSPEAAAVTSQSIAAPTAEAVTSLQASLSAAKESLANNAANMSEQQVALAVMDIAVTEAALSIMDLVLNGEGTLEACLDCYENALAQFEDAVNMGLLDDAQIEFLSEILTEIANELIKQGAML